jgi:hypothetical protein
VWDVNKEAPAAMGGPFDIILAANAVHTCDNLAGESALTHPLSRVYERSLLCSHACDIQHPLPAHAEKQQ